MILNPYRYRQPQRREEAQLLVSIPAVALPGARVSLIQTATSRRHLFFGSYQRLSAMAVGWQHFWTVYTPRSCTNRPDEHNHCGVAHPDVVADLKTEFVRARDFGKKLQSEKDKATSELNKVRNTQSSG